MDKVKMTKCKICKDSMRSDRDFCSVFCANDYNAKKVQQLNLLLDKALNVLSTFDYMPKIAAEIRTINATRANNDIF